MSKDNKNIIIIVVIALATAFLGAIIVIAAAIIIFLVNDSQSVPQPINKNLNTYVDELGTDYYDVDPDPDTLTTEVTGPFTETTDVYEINVDYPTTGVPEVDNAIEDTVNDIVQTFKESAWADDFLDTPIYTLDMTYGESAFSTEVNSIVLSVYEYTGGAHGFSYFETFTYNQFTGEMYEFEDLFTAGSNPLLTIYPIVLEDLNYGEGDFLSSEEWIETGSGYEMSNYQDFALDYNDLTIFFEPYAVAPYAAGPQQVIIPLTELSDLLQTEFIIDPENSLESQGKIWNTDYSFLLTVGEEHAPNIREQEAFPIEGITDTYIYCYETSETDFGSTNCREGEVEVFRVNVYTDAQWEEVQDSPFVGTLMMDSGVGQVFVFSHPNGLLPDDVPATDEFHNQVIDSFNFAG